MNKCICIKPCDGVVPVSFKKGETYYYEEKVDLILTNGKRYYNVVMSEDGSDGIWFDSNVQEESWLLFDDYFITLEKYRENKLKGLVDE